MGAVSHVNGLLLLIFARSDDFLVTRRSSMQDSVLSRGKVERAEGAEVGARRYRIVPPAPHEPLEFHGGMAIQLMTLKSYQRSKNLRAEGAFEPLLILVRRSYAPFVTGLLNVQPKLQIISKSSIDRKYDRATLVADRLPPARNPSSSKQRRGGSRPTGEYPSLRCRRTKSCKECTCTCHPSAKQNEET